MPIHHAFSLFRKLREDFISNKTALLHISPRESKYICKIRNSKDGMAETNQFFGHRALRIWNFATWFHGFISKPVIRDTPIESTKDLEIRMRAEINVFTPKLVTRFERIWTCAKIKLSSKTEDILIAIYSRRIGMRYCVPTLKKASRQH